MNGNEQREQAIVVPLAGAPDLEEIELEKREALRIMNARFLAVSAAKDFEELLAGTFARYGIKREDYNLDLANGVLIPVKRDGK